MGDYLAGAALSIHTVNVFVLTSSVVHGNGIILDNGIRWSGLG